MNSNKESEMRMLNEFFQSLDNFNKGLDSISLIGRQIKNITLKDDKLILELTSNRLDDKPLTALFQSVKDDFTGLINLQMETVQ